jgi:hypothetical protein
MSLFLGKDIVPHVNDPGLELDRLCYPCQRVVETAAVLRPFRRDRLEEKNSAISSVGSSDDVFDHHGQLGALRSSARAGCHFCSLLGGDDPGNPFRYDADNSTSYKLRLKNDLINEQQSGTITLEATGYMPRPTYLSVGEVDRSASTTCVYSSTSSPGLWELGKRWIQECQTTHQRCREREARPRVLNLYNKTNFYPTRLIQVKATGNSVESIRLVVSSDFNRSVPYLTLSHCWGGANIIRLTEDTLNSFQQNIPMEKLPKTFIDAFSITASLGYEYMWIDSLCIVQDSRTDWNFESGHMGIIYQHSTCTIAALRAENSHAGCFVERSALSFLPCQLIPKASNTPGVYAVSGAQPYEPLHKRAWVLQERCLSVRTLNFGAKQVSWDCIDATASEANSRFRRTDDMTSLKRRLYSALVGPDTERSGDKSHWSHEWWELVRIYTSCNITYVTDKWEAFRGLASAIQNNKQSVFIHGLWQPELADELLWTVTQQKAAKLDIGTASWSWLSIDGQVVKYHHLPEDVTIDASVLFSVAAYRKIGFPTIQIGGEAGPQELDISANMFRISWKGSTYQISAPDETWQAANTGMDWMGTWTPDTTPDEAWETWALQILTSSREARTQSSVGLVVVPVSGKEEKWIRVGFYRITWWGKENTEDISAWTRRHAKRADIVLV